MAAVKNLAEKRADVVRRAMEAGDHAFAAAIFTVDFLDGEDEMEAAEIWETWLPDKIEEMTEVFGYICW